MLLPDLYVQMPARPYKEHVAPIYVDAFTQPGHLLYRFDTVILNRGGTLDLYRDAKSGHVIQALWPRSGPTTTPDPQSVPSGRGLERSDRHRSGARIGYVVERSHQHFHFETAASYALEVPGARDRRMPKIGFCMHDTWGAARYFDPGAGEDAWCNPGDPGARFVRMGISPGAGDLYDAATDLQWVDVTGLQPGRYLIRAVANPRGQILESSRRNNVLRQARVIPGVLASPAVVTATPGETVQVPLTARAVAPSIPARASAACEPSHVGEGCYTRIHAADPVTFHGGGVAQTGPHTATATVTRAAPGRSVLTYTATDGRGLTSPPTTIRVTTGTTALPLTFATVQGRTAVLALRRAATVTVDGGRPRRLRAGTSRLRLRSGHGHRTLQLTVRTGTSRQHVRLPYWAG